MTLRSRATSVLHAAGGARGARGSRKAARPDVITLDVMMPDLDGWAVLTALKADPELRDIPVIMLTIIDDRNLGFALGRRRLPDQADRPRAARSGGQPAPSRATARRRSWSWTTTRRPREMLRRMLREGGLDAWPRPRTAARRSSAARACPAGADPARPDDAGDGRLRGARAAAARGRLARRSR